MLSTHESGEVTVDRQAAIRFLRHEDTLEDRTTLKRVLEDDRPLIACYWIQPIDPMWGPVKVERTGALLDGEAVFDVDVWAVRREAWCLNRAGEWELEPQPSSRDDDWLAAHRFSLAEALAAAKGASSCRALCDQMRKEVP
jgi:hypothetical protein